MAEWTLLLEPSGRAAFRFILEIDVGELPGRCGRLFDGACRHKMGFKFNLITLPDCIHLPSTLPLHKAIRCLNS
jgi:hypothetical protein